MIEGGHREYEKLRSTYLYLFLSLNIASTVAVYVFWQFLSQLFPSSVLGCNDSFLSTCVVRQLWSRTGIVNAVLFVMLALVSIVKVSYRLDSVWCIISVGTVLAGYYYAFSIPNSVFSAIFPLVYAGSTIYLVGQSLCVIEIAHNIHRHIVFTADRNQQEGKGSIQWYMLHSFLSVFSIIASVVILRVIFAGTADCIFISFALSFTLWLGLGAVMLSLLTVFNKGLLVPGIIWLYTVLVCWYAKMSYADAVCNSSAETNTSADKVCSMIVFCCIFLFTLYYGVVHKKIHDHTRSFCEAFGVCVACISSDDVSDVEVGKLGREGNSGESAVQGLSNSCDSTIGETSLLLGVRGGGGMDAGKATLAASACKPERSELLLLLAAASCYIPMLFSNWGNLDGSPEVYYNSSGENVAAGSTLPMYLKLFSGLFAWVVYVFSMFNSYKIYHDFIRNSRHK